jgi:hypothetical protein
MYRCIDNNKLKYTVRRMCLNVFNAEIDDFLLCGGGREEAWSLVMVVAIFDSGFSWSLMTEEPVCIGDELKYKVRSEERRVRECV